MIVRGLAVSAVSMAMGLVLAADARAQGTCPPGPTYDDAHGTPGGRVCVPSGDAAFAVQVVSFTPGTYDLTHSCPNTGQFGPPPPVVAANQSGTASGTLGPPDVPFSQFQNPAVRLNNDTSLGGRGRVVLRFNIPLTGDGSPATNDIWVWEVGNIAELYSVEVSPDGATWTTVGSSNTTTNGSQGFDVDHAGFNQTSRLFYARITDVGNQNDGCQAGSDIDAVAVISSITPRIGLVKTAAPTSGVDAGDEVIYSYAVTNTGTDTLLNLQVTDPHPGLSAISCPQNTLAINQTITCFATYIVTQADVNAGIIENTGTARGTPQAGGPDVIATHSAVVTPAAPPLTVDLTIQKTHAGVFRQGQTGTYSIVVTNLSVAASSGTVTVVDTPPSGLTPTAISGTGWTCTLGTLTCTRPDALAGGASFPPISVTVTVSPAIPPGTVINTVVVSGGNDSNPSNNTATDPTPIVDDVSSVVDLTISKTHQNSFTQGQNGTYSVVVTNVGGAPSSGPVTVVDTPPPGFTPLALDGVGWTCVLATVTCVRSDALASGASYPVILMTVRVAMSVPVGTSINTAVVSGGGDTNPANNTATDPTPIMAPPQLVDLALAKTHTGQFIQGQTGTFVLTVTNVGGITSQGAVFMGDTLPAGFTAASLAGEGWTCSIASVGCSRSDTLASGASYPPITLTVNIAADAPTGPAVNRAEVAGGNDSNAANNTATDIVTIVTPVPIMPPAALAILLLGILLLSMRSLRRRSS